MSTRIVRVGRGKQQTEQAITTTYTTEENGAVHEHIALETPNPLSDTAIQRMRTVRESQKVWP